jgi:4-carboxymuconolactone decarboxylase
MVNNRYPALTEQEMSADQRAVHADLLAGPRHSAAGPFQPLLRIPAVLDPLQRAGLALRFAGSLDRDVFEFAVLLVARHWNQAFEWNMHSVSAERAGVPRDVITAVSTAQVLAELTAKLPPRLVVCAAVFDELVEGRVLADATFAAAIEQFGAAGVVELATVFGYYTTLAFVMNAADCHPGEPAAVPLGRAVGRSW